MILSFKGQFVEKILTGVKIHTIREDKKDRWRAWKLIHFATGVRTKNYKQFKLDVCKSVQKIEIKYSYPSTLIDIIIDNRYLTFEEFEILSKNDGFDTIQDFFNWFDKDFKGKIIQIILYICTAVNCRFFSLS